MDGLCATWNGVETIDPAFCDRIATDAADAVQRLWCEEHRTFFQSTRQRDGDDPMNKSHFNPTVTFRCILALARYIEEYPTADDVDKVRSLLHERCATKLAELELKDIHSSHDAKKGRLNAFTLSLYVQALAATTGWKCLPEEVTNKTSARLDVAAEELLTRLGDGKPDEDVCAGIHPFLTLHILVALETMSTRKPALRPRAYEAKETLLSCLRSTANDLLAKHMLGVMNPAEAVALAFCARALVKYGTMQDLTYVSSAVGLCIEREDKSGCWPMGLTVDVHGALGVTKLEIATYEVAWVLADAMLGLLERDSGRKFRSIEQKAVCGLLRAGDYAENTRMAITDKDDEWEGWCDEHPFGESIVNVWSSAFVLESVMSLRGLIDDVNCQIILSDLVTLYPRDLPSRLRWDRFAREAEPDSERKILDYLNENVVKKILDNPRRLPDADQMTVSLLLFGPPGTSKTSIVKAMASGLDWPLVTLSPGNFIQHGLEAIEAEAKNVFEELHNLTRAVVLFDECDQLFMRRPDGKEEHGETRGITSFVTPSMLPKLQDLHDRGRVVFCVCTNHVDRIDPAVLRGGRIDHVIGVGPPDALARRRILEQLKELSVYQTQPHYSVAIEKLTSATESFVYPELKRVAQLFARAVEWDTAKHVEKEATNVANCIEPMVKEYMEEFALYRQKLCVADKKWRLG